MKRNINIIYLLAIAMCLLQGNSLFAQVRDCIHLDDNWLFKYQYLVNRDSGNRVNLPHTWNAVDGSIGKPDYFRGSGSYTKHVFMDKAYASKRLFLYFHGAGTVTDVFVNGTHAGNHKGGFNAFCFEITGLLAYGRDNVILVKVNNAWDITVLPLEGDFVVYGGIYRPVELLVLNKVCISPLDHASPGVSIEQHTTDTEARLHIKTNLSNQAAGNEAVTIKTLVRDQQGAVVAQESSELVVTTHQNKTLVQDTRISHPHLWNGKPDPYLYSVTVLLYRQQVLLDSVTQKIGVRYYRVDANKGFILNGKPYDLHGVSRHESSLSNGNALTDEMEIADFSLINELGATAVRFAHYPYSQTVYNYCDSTGLVVWSEIPFVGPGGSLGSGFYNIPALKENARQQLIEMIRQNYNHPSVCFWGMYNELDNTDTALVPFIKELDSIAHTEDPTRLTTAANNQEYTDSTAYITDVVAWNKYFGWYGHSVDSIGLWLDMVHRQRPGRCIGISEFGAGASILQHEEKLQQPPPKGRWHPEEWQAYFHEHYWKSLQERPFVWCKFIWTMFDFYSAYRNEGDAAGVNDKGLVSMDRKTKKDAFYFYKANWNPAPMIYIADKRLLYRTSAAISIKAYTNIDHAELFVNGQLKGTATPETGVCTWPNILLQKGKNTILVKATRNGHSYEDSCYWYYGETL